MGDGGFRASTGELAKMIRSKVIIMGGAIGCCKTCLGIQDNEITW